MFSKNQVPGGFAAAALVIGALYVLAGIGFPLLIVACLLKYLFT